MDIFIQNTVSRIAEINQGDSDFNCKINQCIETLTHSQDTSQKIATETERQALCQVWHVIRKGRITGSTCDRILSFTGRVPATNLLKLLYDPSSFTSAATQYGIDKEDWIARGVYTAKNKQEVDKQLTVQTIGVFIDQEKGYLGSSPDGLVVCGNGTRGLLEIKCPPKWANTKPVEAVNVRGYPLVTKVATDGQGKLNITFKLKETHKWYHQIQLHLYC